MSLSTVARHLDGHSISTKIADKDADVPFEHNRPATVERRRQYGQLLAGFNINHRLIYVESAYNAFARQMIGRAPVGEHIRREVAPRGRNMNIILAINQEMRIVHHQLGQFTVTRTVFQNFMELVNQASELFPGEDHIHNISTLLFPNRMKTASHCVCRCRTVHF